MECRYRNNLEIGVAIQTETLRWSNHDVMLSSEPLQLHGFFTDLRRFQLAQERLKRIATFLL